MDDRKPLFLYHPDGPNRGRLTQPGVKLTKDASTLMRPMFEEYCKAGFSPREIGHVMLEAISTLEMEGVLGLTE